MNITSLLEDTFKWSWKKLGGEPVSLLVVVRDQFVNRVNSSSASSYPVYINRCTGLSECLGIVVAKLIGQRRPTGHLAFLSPSVLDQRKVFVSVFIHRSRSFCQHRGFGVNVEPVVDHAMQIRIDGQLVWSD